MAKFQTAPASNLPRYHSQAHPLPGDLMQLAELGHAALQSRWFRFPCWEGLEAWGFPKCGFCIDVWKIMETTYCIRKSNHIMLRHFCSQEPAQVAHVLFWCFKWLDKLTSKKSIHQSIKCSTDLLLRSIAPLQNCLWAMKEVPPTTLPTMLWIRGPRN